MLRGVKAECELLCKAVDKITAELDNTGSATPTPYMSRLLIAAEDHRFSSHPGVDSIALCRAFWKCLQGHPQGGSTIAMQLVRTISGCYDKTLRRKVREIVLAICLTRRKRRESLPTVYLWVAYYGWRMNNFRQACLRLNLDPPEFSEFEAAKLVARLKYPEPRQAKIRRVEQIEARARYLMLLEEHMR